MKTYYMLSLQMIRKYLKYVEPFCFCVIIADNYCLNLGTTESILIKYILYPI